MNPQKEVTQALASALRILGPRAHAELELRRKLAKRGFSSEAVDAAISSIYDMGYLDDEQFARDYVRLRGGEHGKSRLDRDLAARGVSASIRERVLAEIDDGDELAKAERLISRRLANMADLPRETKERRLVGYLVRRGFSPATAFPLVRQNVDRQEAAGGEAA